MGITSIPSVGNSKRGIDENDSVILDSGENIIYMHNTYEEYIFSAYLINVIIILMKTFSRIMVKDENMDKFKKGIKLINFDFIINLIRRIENF